MKSQEFDLSQLTMVPLYLINPAEGGNLSTERFEKLADSVTNIGHSIIKEYKSWRDFYIFPGATFPEIVKALNVDLSKLKRKLRRKEKISEDL
jgi:hypothetical protein